jgi:diaminohydroxyphosphoribosylaminopyrimidine deaminase / 5-amino-6-(5-phosphoribosylamino)uracil reductase
MEREDDKHFIERCFKLALLGAGHVSPNPLVGAVIVKDGKIISEGWHEECGKAHAEADAITNAKENLTGATLYCNLEPCCHTNKKTPPCVPKIIESKIKRVVISNIDPNPFVAGKGIEQLRNASIEVTTGALSEEGKELNKFFFKYISKKLPYVTLKVAQSLDGKISEEEGKQTWLTEEESSRFVHSQRATYDAVLVGRGTVNIDNPQLNVRHVNGRNPVRIILDGNLISNIESNCFNNGEAKNTWLFVSKNIENERVDKFAEKGVRIFRFGADNKNVISIKTVLEKLASENISSVLVEGGQKIFSEFVRQNLFDELVILQAPQILGNGLPAFDGINRIPLNLFSVKKLGNDVKYVFKNKTSV